MKLATMSGLMGRLPDKAAWARDELKNLLMQRPKPVFFVRYQTLEREREKEKGLFCHVE